MKSSLVLLVSMTAVSAFANPNLVIGQNPQPWPSYSVAPYIIYPTPTTAPSTSELKSQAMKSMSPESKMALNDIATNRSRQANVPTTPAPTTPSVVQHGNAGRAAASARAGMIPGL